MLDGALPAASRMADAALRGPYGRLAQLPYAAANRPARSSGGPCNRCLATTPGRRHLSGKHQPPHPLVHNGGNRLVTSLNRSFNYHPLSIAEHVVKNKLFRDSALVVANNSRPREQDIKGIVSFQSLAKALMNGNPKTVGDCIDNGVPRVQSNADLKSVVSQLSENDVVLVIGRDKRLQGIVTAWDLAEEFAELVDPFKRIGEIEERLRALVRMRLGKDKVTGFLTDHGISGNNPIAEIEELTMGELQRILEFPEHWDELGLAFDRVVFTNALSQARDYRNRLMHFRDPLTEDEMRQLSNFCDTVRVIQL